MTDREKLIELLYNCPDCGMLAFSAVKRIANYLVYHGVTVMEKGEWEKVRGVLGTLQCSKCGIHYADAVYTSFCPNCGADLRRKNDI